MALDLSREALNARIDALKGGYMGRSVQVRERNVALLRAFSPEFNTKLQEFDQFPEPLRAEDANHSRSSYNLTRAVVEMWTSLEAEDLPAVRWEQDFLPLIPSLDPTENERRHAVYRGQRLVSQTISTMREQALNRHLRRAQLGVTFYNATLRKNVYGSSWSKVWPDYQTRKFRAIHRIDPSTVFPVYSAFDANRLDGILVAYRRSAQSINAEFPGALTMSRDGLTIEQGDYYIPTQQPITDSDRMFAWIEDYWVYDGAYEQTTNEDPVRGLVLNCQRVNGKIVAVASYPGWTRIPYFLHENDNLRDYTGFSDAGSMLPINDSINRFMSQQADVIAGESRPKFKYRGPDGASGSIVLTDEGMIHLDENEDVEQLKVSVDLYPTQLHGTQLMDLLTRVTGLNDTVWGRLAANSNSGRALATAWRSVAARMVPRTMGNSRTLKEIEDFMLDCMELYNWDNARELFNGNRDYDFDWPNKEPRDFLEVTQNALNLVQGGLKSAIQGMEMVGDPSPDQTLEDVRADYTDTVLHPEKAQSYMLLQNLEQDMALKAQQAGMQAQAAQAQLAQLAAQPPGGAPSGATPTNVQAGAATQARAQAAAQAAPTAAPGAPVPATQAGQAGNATKTTVGTLVQDGGAAQNRIITQQQV